MRLKRFDLNYNFLNSNPIKTAVRTVVREITHFLPGTQQLAGIDYVKPFDTILRRKGFILESIIQFTIMQLALDFLTANPVTYFATVGSNGGAKVRPILFCFEENGVLWFCSAKNKNFWKEMKANPNVEFCSFDGSRWIRVSGTIKFDDNSAIKKKILDRYENIRAIYKTPDNSEFVSFCLDHWNATISSFTADPVSFSR